MEFRKAEASNIVNWKAIPWQRKQYLCLCLFQKNSWWKKKQVTVQELKNNCLCLFCHLIIFNWSKKQTHLSYISLTQSHYPRIIRVQFKHFFYYVKIWQKNSSVFRIELLAYPINLTTLSTWWALNINITNSFWKYKQTKNIQKFVRLVLTTKIFLKNIYCMVIIRF